MYFPNIYIKGINLKYLLDYKINKDDDFNLIINFSFKNVDANENDVSEYTVTLKYTYENSYSYDNIFKIGPIKLYYMDNKVINNLDIPITYIFTNYNGTNYVNETKMNLNDVGTYISAAETPLELDFLNENTTKAKKIANFKAIANNYTDEIEVWVGDEYEYYPGFIKHNNDFKNIDVNNVIILTNIKGEYVSLNKNITNTFISDRGSLYNNDKVIPYIKEYKK